MEDNNQQLKEEIKDNSKKMEDNSKKMEKKMEWIPTINRKLFEFSISSDHRNYIYVVMHEKQSPREVTKLVSFPDTQEYKFGKIRFYNKIVEKTNKQRDKYQNRQQRVIKYSVGEKVLLKNQQ